MRKINKVINIILIFTLIGVAVCRNLYALRVPINRGGVYDDLGQIMSSSGKSNRFNSDADKPLEALGDSNLREYIRELLIKGYGQYGIKAELVNSIFDVLIVNQDNPETAVQKCYSEVMTSMVPTMYSIYQPYKKEVKAKIVARDIFRWIKNGTLVDVGCGDNAIGLLLTDKNKKIEVIGLETTNYETVYVSPRVKYGKIISGEDSYSIELENEKADTVLLINVLHHVRVDLMPKVLLEIFRIMKPRARLIIIEDSYSFDLRPKYGDSRMLNEFKMLSSEQKEKFFRFLDWISTRLIHNIPEMPRPHNFHLIEEWDSIISQYSFNAICKEYLGFPGGSFHLIPKGMLVFEKPDIPNLDDYRAMKRIKGGL